jgi:hypothetical protein
MATQGASKLWGAPALTENFKCAVSHTIRYPTGGNHSVTSGPSLGDTLKKQSSFDHAFLRFFLQLPSQ